MERWAYKTVIVIPGHTHCGGDLIRGLISYNVRVIAIGPHMKPLEILRNQMEEDQRKLLINRQCDLHSFVSIKMSVLWISEIVGKVDLIIYLLPDRESSGIEEVTTDDTIIRVQSYLDVCDLCAKVFRQAAAKKLIAVEDKDGNSLDTVWTIYYDLSAQDNVVKGILDRMAAFELPDSP